MAAIDPSRIASVEIYPPIGIARLGNSPTEWFYGPEVPGRYDVPANGFKDGLKRVKRQAARFRVYAYDSQKRVIGELTGASGFALKWSVNVANRKPAWFNFQGRFEGAFKTPNGLRNPKIQPHLAPELRSKLTINGGVKTVQGPRAKPVDMTGEFWGSLSAPVQVYLGEIFTDEHGRLVVLGGRGDSHHVGSKDPYPLLTTDFDNEDWVDDTSDGWVDVVVERNGVTWRPEFKSWVVCGPPKFAAGIYAPTSIYDVIENIMEEKKRRAQGDKYDVGPVDYTTDIEPLLLRPTLLAYVNGQAFSGHGPDGNGHFSSKEWQKQLSDPSPAAEQTRKAVLGRLRLPETSTNPDVPGKYDNERAGQSFPYFMPWLSGDGGRTTPGNAETFTSLTELQYDRVAKWARGAFTVSKPKPLPRTLEELPLASQPAAITKAHLEWCIGLPLYPGIEVSWPAEMEKNYNPKSEFRFRADMLPGDVSKFLSLPWQSDFYMCRNYWWPSARPDAIIPESELKAPFKVGDMKRVPWERGLHLNYTDTYPDQPFFANTDMAQHWHQLGVVQPVEVKVGNHETKVIYVERERGVVHPLVISKEQSRRDHTVCYLASDKTVSGSGAVLPTFKLPTPSKDNNAPITTLESLQQHLQSAMLVELSTIPIYLFAMYSIKSPRSDDPRYVDPHVDAIRGVVAEEMLHLSLAGNTLLAIGGTPRLYDQKLIPIYPRAMLGHTPPLEMNLADVKANLATFIQIEFPKRPNGKPESDEYESLAQFYEAIELGLEYVDKNTRGGIFQQPRTQFQFAPGVGYSPRVLNAGGSVVVSSLETAKRALNEIVEQGEGNDLGQKVAADSTEDNHFTTFMNLVKAVGTSVECWPVISNPVTHKYEDPRIFQVSRTFDAAYCFLLLLIETLWKVDAQDERRKLVFSNMYGVMMGILAPLAKLLVQQPIKGTDRTAAPAFNFYNFGEKPTLASALDAVRMEMQAAIHSYVSVTEETTDQVTVHNFGPQLEALLPIKATLDALYNGQQLSKAKL